jgi:hypothetical protein
MTEEKKKDGMGWDGMGWQCDEMRCDGHSVGEITGVDVVLLLDAFQFLPLL